MPTFQRRRVAIFHNPIAASLRVGLVSAWSLSDLADSVGANALTNNNAVTFAAGKLGVAASFARASSQSLSVANNARLQAGTGSYTIAGWASWTTNGATQMLWSKGTAGAAASEFALYRFVDDKLYLDAGYGSASEELGPTAAVSGSSAQHFIAMWKDAASATINVQIDNGVITTLTSAHGGTTNATAFVIGADGGGNYHDGLIGPVLLYNRLLSVVELTALYNGGLGLAYPFATAPV